MTPQERRRVGELFERLSQLENAPRDREAEELIAHGLRQVPHAPYALIQAVLIQEEALARANERILELEAADGGSEAAQADGFLDSLRGAFAGQPAAPRRGSVPSTGDGKPMGVAPGFRPGAPAAGGQQQEIGRGGSFLGQAASIAAGVLVGSMAADALRGQFGSQSAATNSQQAGSQVVPVQQASHAEDEDGEYDTADFDDGDGFDIGGDFG